jgi:hypothetical protein
MATPRAKTPAKDITFQQQAEAFRAKSKTLPAVNSQTSNPNLPVVATKTPAAMPGPNPDTRKTVAQPPEPKEPKEPRPPKAVSTPPVTPVAKPGTALANQKATAGQGMSEGRGTGPPRGPHPHPSPTARRHANRHARFNRAITDPTLKAWAEGARAAALEARKKYETANPRPAHKSTT